MVKTVHFDLMVKQRFEIEMPLGAEILFLKLVDQIPKLFVLIDPVKNIESRYFTLVAADEILDHEHRSLCYIGEFQLAPTAPIFLCFEIIQLDG